MSLTETEAEILRLLAGGRTYGQLASRYGITITVMKGRLQRMYRKMRVETKVEALLEAGRRGIVSMED